MKFQEFRTKPNTVSEATKSFKVGKGKFKAEIKKKGSKFVASIDGQDLDTFKTEKEAKKFINKMVKPDYDWTDKEELEERFMTIVERKFV